MGVLQKVKTKEVTRYSALGIRDYTEIPAHTELYCFDHIIHDGNIYALCIYNGGLRVIDPNNLFYFENE